VPLSLGSAVASGLSDEESDRAGGKRTLASVFGNRAARRADEASVVLGVVVWLLVPLAQGSREALTVGVAGAGAAALLGWRLPAASRAAVTGAWDAQRTYKGYLHRAIWGGALALAAAQGIGAVMRG
jgi:1,4-dihydroxy-2-naphthoate octaprenyltransferase/chlorophyll synthase